MADDVTITVALEGDEISLASFRTALSAFDDLINALTSEVAGGSTVEWSLEALEVGSAIATVKARVLAGDPEGPARVSAAYEVVGDSLSKGNRIPFSADVQRPAGRLARVLQDHVVAVRLETPQRDFTLSAAPLKVQPPSAALRPSLGAVEGHIETLSRKRGLRFVLYDIVDDRAVACYLQPGNEDMVQQLWGRRAIVEGDIRRDPVTGRPTVIRRITAIIPVAELGPDDWRAARGALPGDGIPAEVAIRQVRDGW